MSTMLKRFFSREKPRLETTNSTTMICCKLFHFPLREKVECIRYIFAFLSVQYESVTINFDDWNANDMASGTPFGELPVLELDNRIKISNTMTIARFLANQYGILPVDSVEQAQADMLVEVIQDLSDKLRPVTQAAFFLKDQERKKVEWNRYKREHLKPTFKRLESFLGDKMWFCGAKICWADLVIAEFLDRLETCYDATALEQYPTLSDHLFRINHIPSVRSYLQYRPKMDY